MTLRALVCAGLAPLLIGISTSTVASAELQRATGSGDVIGSTDEHQTLSWLGVPFAAPPVNARRWLAPQPALAWQKPRTTDQFAAPCMQFKGPLAGDNPPETELLAGSEDCLYLNIWTPRGTPHFDGPLPVMVWIHGGANTLGAASAYNGARLAASQRVVVVSLQYRLGLFGWFRHPSLRASQPGPADQSGNYGTLDIIAGLQWVSDNIANFGGDPANVTVFGESAGGRNTWSMIQSPLASGLFHRAIVQSGSLRTSDPVKSERYLPDDLEYPSYQNSGEEVLLRLLDARDMHAAQSALQKMNEREQAALLRGSRPDELYRVLADGINYQQPKLFRDGHVLPTEVALELLKDPRRYNAVPIITGTNRDEHKLFMMWSPRFVDRLWGFIPRPRDQQAYDRISRYLADYWHAGSAAEPASVISSHGGPPVYVYRFDWDNLADLWVTDLASLLGAAHALEISFVFGGTDSLAQTAISAWGSRHERRQLSRAMMDYWGSFARDGAPEAGGLAPWQPYRVERPRQMVFDAVADGGVRMEQDPVSVSGIKTQLASDPDLSQDERCNLYVSLTLYDYQTPDFFAEPEYQTLGGERCLTDDIRRYNRENAESAEPS